MAYRTIFTDYGLTKIAKTSAEAHTIALVQMAVGARRHHLEPPDFADAQDA